MKLSGFVTGAALVAGATAVATPTLERRSQSVCDKYTKALFGSNTAANQETLLILVVNTAVIGNYSSASTVAPGAPGLLTPTTYDGENVNLLQYFNGALDSTNNGGKCGVSVNFLDGGGATPLMKNKPANNKNTNQYTLLTHLYEFFAGLLGCSKFGNTVMPYAGSNGMYEVHKFMALDHAEVSWFIYNVGASAASFGVSSADVSYFGGLLQEYFGYRCLPPSSFPSFEPPALNSICIDCDCPKGPDCRDYGPVIQPKPSGTPSYWCGSKDWRHSQQWCGYHHHYHHHSHHHSDHGSHHDSHHGSHHDSHHGSHHDSHHGSDHGSHNGSHHE